MSDQSADRTADGLVADLLARCTFPEPAAGTGDADGVVAAVSGGADSLALLVLARAAGLEVTAVHVDHGLRPGSSDEARVVEAAAARFGARFRAETVTLEKVRFFHLNDSQGELGSKRDRHAHIGEGLIGLEGFRFLMNDERFAECPMTLETPKGDEDEMDAVNLATLRGLYEG